ncbi:putative SpoU type methylase [Trypanosoma grayi]|uniref:putative SpoU type methylase n=1 Tax=Trypanosoma grayi TaxID=71804 RepID=UPI0004F4A2B4|nr:putative SpoU type methylase [Trypanosoma grayi]KEG11263.1 putative SpoU type methylase [Trypanosoma grayi]
MNRSTWSLLKRDFDAWAYNIYWPQQKALLPLLGFASLAVEDIKFAYNAWCLLRLAMFYGTEHPKVLSSLVNTTPSMDIAYGGNRLFYMHAKVEVPLSRSKTRVALTPCHPRAQPLQNFPWRKVVCEAHERGSRGAEDAGGVEIVLGMENGLSNSVAEDCDYCLYIPQYGSIGSLSMLSAMAIAVHSAHSAHYTATSDACDSLPQPSKGHMPLSNGDVKGLQGKSMPHEKDLIHLNNKEIARILEARRLSYRLQLSVVVYNEFGDRNIGAIMRNANVYNCEQMVVLHRRKFSRRGAVGTQNVLWTSFHASIDDADCQLCLRGNVIWLLHQYYPYLKIHGDHMNDTAATFIRPENPSLQQWVGCDHRISEGHPIMNGEGGGGDGAGAHLIGTEVYLDDLDSLRAAVEGVVQDGYRGIMLAIPEEGASPHPDIVKCAQRIVYLVHPSRLARGVQRGLNGALSSAVALERLRTAIDGL